MTEAGGSPRNRQELVDLLAAGHRVKFLFFWGHRPPLDGGVGPGCLSQWWPASFTVEGIRYLTAEHYMMVAKARLFHDDRIAEKIISAPSPGAAKALGRGVNGFDQNQWQQHRMDIVIAANTAKFGQNPDLRAYLANTEDRVLVEASPVDRIWGIGMTADDPHAHDPTAWNGLNLLGFALMATRTALTTA
jgi:ribA/ribD-fused uncharacterized protein